MMKKHYLILQVCCLLFVAVAADAEEWWDGSNCVVEQNSNNGVNYYQQDRNLSMALIDLRSLVLSALPEIAQQPSGYCNITGVGTLNFRYFDTENVATVNGTYWNVTIFPKGKTIAARHILNNSAEEVICYDMLTAEKARGGTDVFCGKTMQQLF